MVKATPLKKRLIIDKAEAALWIFVGIACGGIIFFLLREHVNRNQYPIQNIVIEREEVIDMAAIFVISAVAALVFLASLVLSMNRRRIVEAEKSKIQKLAKRQEILLESIVKHMPNVLFAKDIKNNFSYSVINSAAAKLFGYPADEMIGKNDYDYFSTEEANSFRQGDLDAIKNGGFLTIDCETVTTKNGKILAHTKKVIIPDEDGNPDTMVGILEDITDRKRNEEELRRHRENLEAMVIDRTERLNVAMHKAEELSRLKSDFLATMSHEIRTPMNGILGMAELILGSKPNIQTQNYAKTIINSGETLLNIINDILDFSKIEAGKMEFDPMPVDMLELVDDVVLLHSVKARDKAIELAVRYAPGTDQFLFADPIRMRQILGNMLSNAIKFTEQGHVCLTVEEDKDVALPTDKIRLKFSVKDTGIGLSEDAKGRIFEKFSQADSSTTRKYGGTGLGLSICNSLVELMGGTIGVESTFGSGSTFWFSLPFTRNHAIVQARINPPTLKDVKVLIVDDLPIIRTLVSEQLQMAGMRCESARSGEHALELLRRAAREGDPFQIAIIDYLMPEMNGEMLASAINDHEDLRSTCLIMLTAAGNPLSDDHFADKGFSAYMAKPVRAKALIEGLAYIWGKYNQGHKNILIHLDAERLGKDEDMDEHFILPEASILIAEDNLVNQVFIREILEEMRCQYTIVSNGMEAVDMIEQNHFDLIIMDCLMPVLDGFEATTLIRKKEQASGKSIQIPVIALTANAMKGDRERCLEAGMNDYLSKPVRKKELKEAVFKWTKNQGDQAAQPAVISFQKSVQVLLDMEAIENARNILKGKYGEMVETYIVNCAERIEEMQHAIEQNIEAIIRPAHTLKSISRQMGAMRLADIAMDIEYTAKALAKGEPQSGKDSAYIQKLLKDLPIQLQATKEAFRKI